MTLAMTVVLVKFLVGFSIGFIVGFKIVRERKLRKERTKRMMRIHEERIGYEKKVN